MLELRPSPVERQTLRFTTGWSQLRDSTIASKSADHALAIRQTYRTEMRLAEQECRFTFRRWIVTLPAKYGRRKRTSRALAPEGERANHRNAARTGD
jgi:hypothetical protein